MKNDLKKSDEDNFDNPDLDLEPVLTVDNFIKCFDNEDLDKVISDCSEYAFVKPIATVVSRALLSKFPEEFNKTILLWIIALNLQFENNDVCIRVNKDNLTSLFYEYMIGKIAQLSDDLLESSAFKDEMQSIKNKIANFVNKYSGGVSSEDCINTLLNSPSIIGTKTDDETAFILNYSETPSEARLYFRRIFCYEQNVSNFIHKNQDVLISDENQLLQCQKLLDIFFPNSDIKNINWQKVAVASSVLSNFSVICGGPGTGKTTTVFKLLLLLCALQKDKNLRIMLAAPTGKAATRMVESITDQMADTPGNEIRKILSKLKDVTGVDIETRIPRVATTLHSLIRRIPHRELPNFNKNNPLPCDILVVDEISMISLDMFSKLIDAIGTDTKLIMLGDKDQLCSVEPGKVMADICSVLSASKDPNLKKIELISKLTGYEVNALLEEQHGRRFISKFVSMLKYSWRFSADSKLGEIAKAINEYAEEYPNDREPLLSLKKRNLYTEIKIDDILMDERKNFFAGEFTENKNDFFSNHNPVEVTFVNTSSKEVSSQKNIAKRIARETVRFYLNQQSSKNEEGSTQEFEFLDFLKHKNFMMRSDEDVRTAFELLDKFRVLCATKNGPLGTYSLNELICEEIKSCLKLKDTVNDNLFLGEVILVTQNNSQLGVDNGDIGFIAYKCYKKDESILRVFFPPRSGKEFRYISPQRLNEYEPGFVMTIHKSQGSEYKNVLMVLGNSQSKILTKELIYTGLTRAKVNKNGYGGKVSIISSSDVLNESIMRLTQRESGLAQMLSESI